MGLNFLMLLFLIFVSIDPSAVNAANILGVFTANIYSHFQYSHAIMESLADAGHRITFISPFPRAKSYKNIEYIDSGNAETATFHSVSSTNFKRMSWQQVRATLIDAFEKQCYDLINANVLQKLLNSPDKKYDLIFVETILMHECYLPIGHKLAAPVIGTIPMRNCFLQDKVFGNKHALIYPFIFWNKPVRMSFFERLQNVLDHLQMEYMIEKIVTPKLQKFYDLHYPDYDPSWNKNIEFLFANWDPSFLPKATVPTVAGIAGIHIHPVKALPQDIREFVDGAQNGVILFSIGTYTSTKTLEPKLISLFVDVFAQLPQRVIWKFGDDIPNLPKNILLMPWIPQRDILAHKNVKAFITHTGINGALEAIYEAKLLIMMPIFGDQISNAAMLTELGVGETLAIQKLTKTELLSTVNKVANDPSYSERIRALSRAFKDRPMSPQETVVYWTEYVLRHNGTAHLRPVTADTPLYSYYLLDIFLFITICVILIFFALYYAVKKIYVCFRSNRRTFKKSVKTD